MSSVHMRLRQISSFRASSYQGVAHSFSGCALRGADQCQVDENDRLGSTFERVRPGCCYFETGIVLRVIR